MNNIEQIIKNFENVKVLVIGDLMLDEYIHGDVNRISPEAPVPIVHIKDIKSVPGGAANTARNIASLGGKVRVIGAIGQDPTMSNSADISGRTLLELLYAENIDARGILAFKNYSTIKKSRIIAHTQQLLRIDQEEKFIGHNDFLSQTISLYIENSDVVIVSDYAKGLINQDIANLIKIQAKKYSKKIIVDTKPINSKYFKDVYLVKPNTKEAKEMTELEIFDQSSAIVAGKKLQQYFNSNILLTRGEYGMDLFENDTHENIPTKVLQLSDVSGAGDTVIATLALGIGSNLSLKQSSEIANYAAGVVVEKFGTATVTPEELVNAIRLRYNQ